MVCKSGGKLNAHHLNGWADFPDERIDIDNGATLCKKCHREYHSYNGGTYNVSTKESFSIFLEERELCCL